MTSKKVGLTVIGPKKGLGLLRSFLFLELNKKEKSLAISDTAIVGQSVIIHYFSETGPPVQSMLIKPQLGFAALAY